MQLEDSSSSMQYWTLTRSGSSNSCSSSTSAVQELQKWIRYMMIAKPTTINVPINTTMASITNNKFDLASWLEQVEYYRNWRNGPTSWLQSQHTTTNSSAPQTPIFECFLAASNQNKIAIHFLLDDSTAHQDSAANLQAQQLSTHYFHFLLSLYAECLASSTQPSHRTLSEKVHLPQRHFLFFRIQSKTPSLLIFVDDPFQGDVFAQGPQHSWNNQESHWDPYSIINS